MMVVKKISAVVTNGGVKSKAAVDTDVLDNSIIGYTYTYQSV